MDEEGTLYIHALVVRCTCTPFLSFLSLLALCLSSFMCHFTLLVTFYRAQVGPGPMGLFTKSTDLVIHGFVFVFLSYSIPHRKTC